MNIPSGTTHAGGMRTIQSKRVQLRRPLCALISFVMAMATHIVLQAKAQDPGARADRLELMRHSFDSPLTYDNTLAEWQFGGTAVASKTGVVLVPGVGDRKGQFWHKLPLKTSNFELEFQFRIAGPEDQPPGSPGFAFWYSQEAPEFPSATSPADAWNLFGHKNVYKGAAVFFSQFDRDNQAKSSVSFLANDGTQNVDIVSQVPSGDGIYFSPIRNTKDSLVFKLTAGPLGIVGQLRLLTSNDWTDCFRLPKTTLLPGGHIGFSSSTPNDPLGSKPYERVLIEKLRVYNLDLTQPGEDSEVLQDTLKDVEVGDLLSENKHGHNIPDVADELRQLSRLMYKQISEQQPRENTIIRHLVTQSSIIEQLTIEVRDMQKRLDGIAGADNKPHEAVHAMKDELQGLRSLFHSHSKHQENLQNSLSSLQKSMSNNPASINQFAERSAALEATIKQQATFSSWMIFGVIIMIAMFALFMWKRMRDMEKKHFL